MNKEKIRQLFSDIEDVCNMVKKGQEDPQLYMVFDIRDKINAIEEEMSHA